jgi:hypothetical protein
MPLCKYGCGQEGKYQLKIQNSIDKINKEEFQKLGWNIKLAKELNVSHTQTARLLKKYFPEFYETCYNRNKK